MKLFTNSLIKPQIPEQSHDIRAHYPFRRALLSVKGVTMRIQLLIVLLLAVCLQATAAANFVTGKVIDADTHEPLVSATVTIKGTSKSTSAGLDGTFRIDVSGFDNPVLVFTYLGYIPQEISVGGKTNLGEILLKYSATGMKEVVVNGDIAIDRKTPVAITNIGPQFIEEHLGANDIPELLKSVPGVMFTAQDGGYGDSRISIRGFSSRSGNGNVAFTINGIPVNDPETGTLYWSDFSGITDVAELHTGTARPRRIQDHYPVLRRYSEYHHPEYRHAGRRLCIPNPRQRWL